MKGQFTVEEVNIVKKVIFQIVSELFDVEILDRLDDQRKLNEIYLSEEEIAVVSTVIEDEFDILLPSEFLDYVNTLSELIGFVQRALCSSR